MATTQKKRGGQRPASGSKKKSSTSTKSKSSASGRGKKKPQKRPFRREMWAFICLLLAVFSAFGYFRIEAIFIDFFCGLVKGLLGYGYWLTPPALLMCSWILAFHRGRPVRLRVSFALGLPLMFSCVLHGLLSQVLPWDQDFVKNLWDQGQLLASGGVLGGMLSQAAVQVFSKLGATIIYTMSFPTENDEIGRAHV